MFTFGEYLPLDPALKVHYEDVLEYVWPLLTPERKTKIESVVRQRSFSVVTVLENIYDRGNSSAVMRTAEAFGFPLIHMIETGEKFKEANRVTAGADKWMEVSRWKNSKDCVLGLQKNGFQVLATHLDSTSKDIRDLDLTQPTAIVLGNEKDGISQEMISLADHRVIIPMSGFVQSFNISVAGALCLSLIRDQRQKKYGECAELDECQMQILKAEYALRTLDSAKELLIEQNNRKLLKRNFIRGKG